MRFVKKPIHLPVNYRFSYQLSIIILIIQYSCQKNVGSSTLKLQLLAWALRDEVGCESLLNRLKDKRTDRKFSFWALDPSLNRAIEFALADGFISIKNEKFHITDKGQKIISKIDNERAFLEEILTLKRFGKSLTESFVNDVLRNNND